MAKISVEIDTEQIEKDVNAELMRVISFEMDAFVKENIRSMVIKELDRMEKQQYSVLVQRVENILDDALVKASNDRAITQSELTRKTASLQRQIENIWERMGWFDEDQGNE